MKREMFYSAGGIIFKRAKVLRNLPTDAERILWMHLRSRPKGYKFSGNIQPGIFILDFYCHSLRLAIEADGTVHDSESVKNADHERQSVLERDGIKFLRFRNHEIIQQFNNVKKKIDDAIDKYSKNIFL